MRRWLTLIVAAGWCTAAALPSQDDEAGFMPLFNGKDLSGWVVENEGKFQVRGGVIFLDRGAGWLRSESTYRDFELRLAFRFLGKNADSGIFFRATREGSNWPAKCYQVQTMDNESIAAIFATGLTRPKSERDTPAMRKARKPTGEWQQYRIIAKGDRAQVFLNGALITNAKGLDARPGHIGLQGVGGQLEFKDIRIRKLD